MNGRTRTAVAVARRARRVGLAALTLGAALVLSPLAESAAAKPGAAKVTICHVPPGNPAGAHTIVVGAPAVAAHLAHGDSLGECAPACGENGAACSSAGDCCSGFCGAGGACATPCADNGGACGSGAECCSGFCDEDGACATPCTPDDGTCSADGDCCSGFCDDDGLCIAPCEENGSPCDSGGDCCDGICTDTLQTCADQCTVGPELNGFPCSRDLDCCEGNGSCIFGLCFKGYECSAPGEPCDLDEGQFCCFFDNCIGGVCVGP